MASGSDQMDVDGGGREDRNERATSVLSIDDLEAAQALEGLKSDTSQSSPPQPAPASASEPPPVEPLLSLLTSSHPLLSSAINGSVSMYTSSKSYSPRFRSGAEFLERNIGSRVVNTVGTVGRKTGVEGGLRWALQRREAAAAAAAAARESEGDPNKQTPTPEESGNDTMDIEKGLSEDQQFRPSPTRQSSNLSMTETLPPYDTHSSPSYEELVALDSKLEPIDRSQRPSTWKGRLAISTSGLGVAMSEESLRSLAYCLTWLRWANTRLGNVMIALKRVLREFENPSDPEQSGRNSAAVAQQIQQLKGEVLQTLKQVVDIVSKYAGSALPENARNLVRRHLTSLPRRFRIASTSNLPAPAGESSSSSAAQGQGDNDTATNAHRALVLAEEGLDMMAQVSRIVNDTLVSAESWCEQLRRPKPSYNNNDGSTGESGRDSSMPPPPPALDDKPPVVVDSAPREEGDVEMSGMQEKS